MDLQQLAKSTFVLLQATWSVEKSYQLIKQLRPSHVIIHCSHPQDVYYLLSVHEVLDLLEPISNASSVEEVLQLHTRPATPAFESCIDAEDAPDRCIILEEGHLIGFFDVSISPRPTSLHRGEGESSEAEHLDSILRSLVAEFPEKVHLNESFSVLVSLSASPAVEKGTAMPFSLPLGTAVDIIVLPQRGFVLEGFNEGTLIVVDEEESLPLQFKLHGDVLGPGQLRVLAFHKGQSLGEIKPRITVLDASTKNVVHYRSRTRTLVSVRNSQLPDLQILILEYIEAGKPAFTLRLTAQDSRLELNYKSFGPIHLRVDPRQYFEDFYRDIEYLQVGNAREQTIAEHRLAAKGCKLFQSLFPKDLQQLLWSLQKRIQTVEVQSVEPWIPWELCRLCGQENGRVIEGPFMCEAFAMTRWIPEISKKAHLSLKNAALVAPSDSKLAWALRERDYILSLADNKRQVTCIPATFIELCSALASGKHDGWHFTGHGAYHGSDPHLSTILLQNREYFTPEDLSGMVSNLGAATPFVFFNACQVGRSSMSLTDIGGWAKGFLDANASAFIGPYWSIYDKPAFDFAKELYRCLFTGVPIGKAVQKARLAIKKKHPGNTTWLAYTVFADPLAIVHK